MNISAVIMINYSQISSSIRIFDDWTHQRGEWGHCHNNDLESNRSPAAQGRGINYGLSPQLRKVATSLHDLPGEKNYQGRSFQSFPGDNKLCLENKPSDDGKF